MPHSAFSSRLSFFLQDHRRFTCVYLWTHPERQKSKQIWENKWCILKPFICTPSANPCWGVFLPLHLLQETPSHKSRLLCASPALQGTVTGPSANFLTRATRWLFSCKFTSPLKFPNVLERARPHPQPKSVPTRCVSILTKIKSFKGKGKMRKHERQ